MKNIQVIVAIVLILGFNLSSEAQVPSGIPYQAVARDASGNLLVNQMVGFRLSILSDNPATGTVHYQEIHSVMTTDLGQINLSIGSGTVVSGVFSNIPWSDSQVRLQVEMDPSGGTSYSVSGVTVFGTVPYAFRSGSSTLSGNGVPNGTMAGQTLRWNGTSWEASSNLVNSGTNVSINAGTTPPDLALSLGDNNSADGGIVARGQYFTGSGILGASGYGTRLIWYPRKAAFRAGHVSGTHWNESSIGNYSFAGGADAIASGQGSVAIGSTLNASGQGAVALGGSNTASGWNSFSVGYHNLSSGFYSSSMGGDNIASGNYSTVTGQFNVSGGENSFAGGYHSVASGLNSFAFGYGDTATANGSVAMGINSKAIDAGAISLGISNKASGQGAVAIGQDNKSLMSFDMSLGYGSVAQGGASLAAGYFNKASDDFSIAIGSLSLASGQSSISIGRGDSATAENTIAVGGNNLSLLDYAISIGSNNKSTAVGSLTLGMDNLSSGTLALSIGNNNISSGFDSRSIGNGLLARSCAETAMGYYNTDYTPLSTLGYNQNDRLFVLGNGDSPFLRKNAMVVLKGGNVGIGDDNPEFTFVVGSGEKFSINSLGDIIKIKNLQYAWPTSYSNTEATFLTNDGTGSLSWGPISASAITGTVMTVNLPSTIAYTNTSNSFSGYQVIENTNPSYSPLSIYGAPGQSNDLTSWFSSAGSSGTFNAVAYMSNSGNLVCKGVLSDLGSFISSSALSVPLRVRGTPGQAGALTEWSSSSGVILASINSNGVFTGNGSGLTNVTASGLADNTVSTSKIVNDAVNGAKIAMGSDVAGDMLYYNGTDYVRLAAGTDGQVLKMSGGVPVWSTTPSINNVLTSTGSFVTPKATLDFISPTVNMVISNTSQKVLLDVSCALGAGGNVATGLNIYPGYKLNGTTSVNSEGGGIWGLTCPVNTRNIYSISTSITGLAPGTYLFGMAGQATANPSYWSNGEYCYVRAVLVNN